MTDPTPDFGPPGRITLDDFIGSATRQICPVSPETEMFVDAKEWPGGDHGHTMCYFVGNLLALNAALLDWADTAMPTLQEYGYGLGDVRDLQTALDRIKNSTF